MIYPGAPALAGRPASVRGRRPYVAEQPGVS